MKTEIKDIKIGDECEISGWIEKFREQKTMLFIVLRDRSGQIQVTIEKAKMPDISKALSGLMRDSVIRVKGVAVEAEFVKLGGIEFLPKEIVIESVAQNLPIDSESSQEIKLDYRWIDLRDEKKRLIFEIRTFVEQAMREYFVEHGFIEIHTPKISSQCSEGGAEVFAVDYYGQKAYLTQSPQFYKQMAIASGFEKVFEIGPYYRAERSYTPRHTAESTCVDFEIADVKSHHEIMDFEEGWILYVLQKVKEKYGSLIKSVFDVEVKLPSDRIPRIKLCDVFKIFKDVYGIDVPEAKQLDLDPEAEKLICDYARDYLGSELVFITDYPAEARAFYSKKYDDDSLECMSLDLLYRGWEMNSGAVREHRYEVLKKQIQEKGIDPEKMSGYLEFFKYGCPPHGGIGFGIDRFMAKLLDLPSIKDSIFVFRGPSRLVP